MELTVLGSNSAGNCYVLQDDTEALIIEAGVSLAKVKQALGFNVRKVSGCIISHSHGDHSKYAKDFEFVFPVYANSDVLQKKPLKRSTEIMPDKGFMVGNFKVYPFPGAHDVPVLGFLVNHPKFGNLVFITDTFLCGYHFKNLNHILIECNYSDSALARSVANGVTHPLVAERVMVSHMELQTCKDWLIAEDLTNVYNVLLVHMSEKNADENEFHQVISSVTGLPVVIAKPGVKMNVTNQPF